MYRNTLPMRCSDETTITKDNNPRMKCLLRPPLAVIVAGAGAVIAVVSKLTSTAMLP
jgi:hypothetical protein